jgi:hypothetical protein
VEAKEHESDKIEKSRPDHGVFRRKDARGNYGRDGICRIVEAVEKIKKEGKRYQYQYCYGHFIFLSGKAELGILYDYAFNGIGEILAFIDRRFEMVIYIPPLDYFNGVLAVGKKLRDGRFMDHVALILKPVQLNAII